MLVQGLLWSKRDRTTLNRIVATKNLIIYFPIVQGGLSDSVYTKLITFCDDLLTQLDFISDMLRRDIIPYRKGILGQITDILLK